MRKRQERSKFLACVADGATHSDAEIFLDSLFSLRDLGPCLGLASLPLLHPDGFPEKPLLLPLSLILWPHLAEVRPSLGIAPQRFPITCCQGFLCDGTSCPCILLLLHCPCECCLHLLLSAESPAPWGPEISGCCLPGKGRLASTWAATGARA